ncbi:MAG: hypothetical protein A3E80_06420 [Chlamydiae bacterium RIFCSPHIGHO2_12_FULL_49_9]|nr:MAG: hypothetical protein A3E80_06420 [Chlamydiae bacterium RIFCSPHIGHO2_12_FULL_49_9]
MATARIESIDNINLSALTAELLQESTSNIVALDTSSIPTGKSLRTTTAPSLVETDKNQSFLEALAEFMELIGTIQVFLNQNESKTNRDQNGISQKMVDQARKNLKDVEKAIKKYEAAKRAAAHRKFWGQVFGGIAMALGCILAAFTGGATLLLVMATLTVLMATGQTQKLDNALKSAGLSDWECFAVKLAIVIAVSAAGGGIAAAGDSLMVTEAEAGDAAAVAISDELAADAGAEASTASETSGFSSNSYMVASQAVVAFNPFVDMMMGIMGLIPGGDEKKKKIAAEVIGNILALIISMRCGAAAGEGAAAQANASKAKTYLTEKLGAEGFALVYSLLDASRMGTSLTASGFYIAMGVAEVGESEALRESGEHQKYLILAQKFLEIMSPFIQSQTNLMKQTNDTFAQMTSQWSNFVRPGAVAAEILG